ncbi:NADase-type glycan-binding domain-containing protein [Treponema sp.]|uniref:NADase-type glycan-binding domain-containing protein n=1 Tax=Treponema sp. TaxID=166 RepID=UPI00298D65F6|nr:hypothetical protein [Treponema sp.]MCR5613658.1 hypothetical protein [Treponema sp.]
MNAKKFIIYALTAFMLSQAAGAQIHPNTPRTYDFELSDIAKRITPVLSFNANMHKDGWIWKEGRSSALIEKGMPEDTYEITKINDIDMAMGENNTATAWVEGVAGDGIGEFVIIPVKPWTDEISSKLMNGEAAGQLYVRFCICNGFQKSLEMYYKNNRIKEAKISIYAAAYSCGENDAYLLWNPDCIFEKTITLNDEVIENPICLNYQIENFPVTLPEKYKDKHCELYLKLEIRSVYKGTKYSDTCIADMSASVSLYDD